MKLKLYIFNLVANIQDDISKVVNYFASRGITLQIDQESTQVRRENIPPILISNDGKYDTVIYMYDRSAFPTPSFGMTFDISKTLRGIYLACDTVDDSVDYTWKSMCHEILHSLVYKIQSDKSVVIPNLLDFPLVNGVVSPYYGNEDLNLVGGNFDQQWKSIAQYLTPIVALHRFRDDGVQTLGDLTISDFTCKTLERPWKNNQKNISCIPVGLYDVRWTFSLKLMRYTYEVMNVPSRSGIRLHKGNFFFDVDGCILLGTSYGDLNHDAWADIVNTTETIKKFEDFMQRKPFQLLIT